MRTAKRCVGWASFLAAVLVTSAGCGGGSKPVKVEGTVTLDGKPLPRATVSFMPVGEGRAASGETDADGIFRLTTFRTNDGALPGEYKVIVTVTELDPRMSKPSQEWSVEERKAARMTMSPMGKKQAAEKKHKTPPAVPAVYSDPKRTPLKEVVPPPGKVELDLNSKAV
jgi:hypothetical protein